MIIVVDIYYVLWEKLETYFYDIFVFILVFVFPKFIKTSTVFNHGGKRLIERTGISIDIPEKEIRNGDNSC